MSTPISKPWLKYYTDWTTESLAYGTTTLPEIYRDNLAKNRDQPATRFFGRGLTYGELDKEVQRAAAGLKSFGVGSGDRVAIMLPNCPQHVVAFYAVQLLGAVVIEHNPLYTTAELRPQFQNHGAHVAIVWDKTVDTAKELRADTDLETVISVNMTKAMPKLQQLALRIPISKVRKARAQLTAPATDTISWEALCTSGSSDAAIVTPEEITPESPAVILYTSGTTGQPKGAVLTHKNLHANALQGKSWVKSFQQPGQRMLATLPFFHAYGLTFSLTLSFVIGSEVVLLPAPKMELIMGAIKKLSPTFMPGVPTLFERIIAEAKKQDIDMSAMKIGFSGASSIPEKVISDWEAVTGGHLVEGYGLTETAPVITGNPQSSDRRPGYIGLPFPDTDIRIANPDNLDETLGYGEDGEILVRGPQVFNGYLDNEEATEKAFHDGWFRTGDMGFMEPDGFIKLVSRIKELIITGGFNVYPEEVENVLRKHKDIHDIAVVGRPRADGSEDVVACVILEDTAELDTEALKSFARERLTRYKVPRTFYKVSELTRDPMGKISRRGVREELLSELED